MLALLASLQRWVYYCSRHGSTFLHSSKTYNDACGRLRCPKHLAVNVKLITLQVNTPMLPNINSHAQVKLQLKRLTNTKAVSINLLSDANIGQDVLRLVKVACRMHCLCKFSALQSTPLLLMPTPAPNRRLNSLCHRVITAGNAKSCINVAPRPRQVQCIQDV